MQQAAGKAGSAGTCFHVIIAQVGSPQSRMEHYLLPPAQLLVYLHTGPFSTSQAVPTATHIELGSQAPAASPFCTAAVRGKEVTRIGFFFFLKKKNKMEGGLNSWYTLNNFLN